MIDRKKFDDCIQKVNLNRQANWKDSISQADANFMYNTFMAELREQVQTQIDRATAASMYAFDDAETRYAFEFLKIVCLQNGMKFVFHTADMHQVSGYDLLITHQDSTETFKGRKVTLSISKPEEK